jgi:elongation factor Ts
MTSDPRALPASPLPGAIGSYIHAGGKVGVLVELACESEFVSRTEEFSQLMHDIAMQIAASDPEFIRKEDVTPEAYEREKDLPSYRQWQASAHRRQAVRRKYGEVLRGSVSVRAALH